MFDKLKKAVAVCLPSDFHVIHGDCTFSNIMLSNDTLMPILIDPRGYFGQTKIYGDVDYDWAKLYYSLKGDYDQFNMKNFMLDIKEDDIIMKIGSNNWGDKTFTRYYLAILNNLCL
jgi:Ser/Thr protein kinase RdoA (MazF antagonist)